MKMYPELYLLGYLSCNSSEHFALVPPVVKRQMFIVTEGGIWRQCLILEGFVLSQHIAASDKERKEAAVNRNSSSKEHHLMSFPKSISPIRLNLFTEHLFLFIFTCIHVYLPPFYQFCQSSLQMPVCSSCLSAASVY